MVDVSKLKPGDVVHVRARVDVAEKNGLVKMHTIEPHPDYLSVDEMAIVHVEPREIRVGDRVLFTSTRRLHDFPRGTVKAIDECEAWVKWKGLGHPGPIVHLSDLTHAQDDTP